MIESKVRWKLYLYKNKMSLNSLKTELEDLKKKNLLRSLRQMDSDQDAIVTVDGQKCVNFSSNNYLGLANDHRLKSAAIQAIQEYGTGSGASRLITGSMKLHHELEAKIAEFKGAEATLLFNSGYHANIGILSALLRKEDVVFSDQLNHASIIDGCRLSGAKVRVYPHCNVVELEELLAQEVREVRQVRAVRRVIATDSIFSMDGDAAPLAELMSLAEKYDAWLMVDEAHATGVYGAKGSGLIEEMFPLREKNEVSRERLIQMGTLGKALGSFGAYVAGPKVLIDYLINKSRSFIYTTALPPAIAASALAAIEIVEKESSLREKLWENIDYFNTQMKGATRRVAPTELKSPIIPLIVEDSEKALTLSQKLFEKGMIVTAIRYPTVAQGTERLRITLMATHTKSQIDLLIEALHELL